MDLRQHNTQERIVAGLIDCLEAKPFRELENKDIYNKAGITYRIFFRYYSDKNELLNDLEKSLINGLQSALIKDRNSLIGLKHEPDPDDILTLADPAFRHTLLFCDKYKRNLRALVSKNGDILFVRKIQNVAEKDLLNEIELHRTTSLTYDPYWCLHSALSHQPGLIKEVIYGNINIIDKLVQIAHTCFPNNSVFKIRTHIQLICMIINIKNTNKFSDSDSSISAFSKVTQDFLKTLKWPPKNISISN